VLFSEYSNTQAPPEEIWRVAKNVWDNMPNSTIARGFVLAKRIMQQVIRFRGDNTFLLGKEFQCGVRNDFESVVKGIVKKQIASISY
jgi:ABC-type amino acid transport system permease subunit